MKKTICLLALCALAPAAWAQQPAANEGVRLSLRDAVVNAVERNLGIAVSRYNPQIDAQGVIVEEAQFDPQATAQASYERNETEPQSALDTASSRVLDASVGWFDPLMWGGSYQLDLGYTDIRRSGSQFLQDEQSDANLTLTYNQSLLRNFGVEINRTQIELALVDQRISESQLRQLVSETLETVENTYWTLVGARRQRDVAMASLDLAKDFLRQTKIRVDVGTLPPIEITTAEAEVADREERVILADQAIRDAEDILRAQTRVPQDSAEWTRTLIPTDEPGFSPVAIDVEKAVATAIERRPELAQGQLAIRSAELSQRFTENQVRPDLRASAFVAVGGNAYDASDLVQTGVDEEGNPIFSPRYQGRTEAFSELASLDNNSYGAALTFAYPIGNRAAKAQATRAKLATERTKLELERVRQTIRVEVQSAVRAVEAAAKRVATTRANVVLQRRKLDAEQKRYENGLSTAFQVLTFQTDLRDAESREITAVVDYNRALATLSRVQGTLLDERGVKM